MTSVKGGNTPLTVGPMTHVKVDQSTRVIAPMLIVFRFPDGASNRRCSRAPEFVCIISPKERKVYIIINRRSLETLLSMLSLRIKGDCGKVNRAG